MYITPIHSLKTQFHGNRFFVKREDLLPISFGGNKARKAALFFSDIEFQGNDCVVTYGSSRSNHCRVVANMAASRQLPCYVVSPSECNIPTNNSRILKLLKTKVILTKLPDVSDTIDRILDRLRAEGLNPYFIEGGGHGNLGTQAYVNCYEEIVMQEKALGVYFDYIFLPSGTGTTQAGLVCGKLINGDGRKIVGISIARTNPRGCQVVFDSVMDYVQSHKLDISDLGSVSFVDDYVQDGYGSCNREILDVIHTTFVQDGIPLDITYTGKAFWGMQKYLQKHGIRGKNILFIHTGGTPLFFDDLGGLVNDMEC